VAKKEGRPLVIDASIAQAAGESRHPVSSASRAFLEAVLRICHKLVLTAELSEEWKSHASLFTRRWQRSMDARKKVIRVGSVKDNELRGEIELAAPSDAKRYEMLKDTHLIEAALRVAAPIISADDFARNLFKAATLKVGRLRQVVWANPAKPDEYVLTWLEEGAEPDPAKCPGASAEDQI
jgi:hypothetical protein